MRNLNGGWVVGAALLAIAAQRPAAIVPSDSLLATAKRFSSTVVAYTVKDDVTVVQVVAADRPVTQQDIPVPRQRLEELVRASHLGQANPDPGAYRVLYELLVGPLRASLPGRDSLLTIVADGPLAELSFAALSNENGRYLLEDYRLHYLSNAMLGLGAASARPARRDRFLFVAYPQTAGSLREAREVTRALGLRDEKLLAGKSATKRTVLKEIGIARVVDLATIRLAGDAVLNPEEIAALHLSTELVVFRAPGDTPLALPRVFLTAGVRAVLATLWPVDESSARDWMPRFYQEWQKSGDKSGALRIAQLSALHDLRAKTASWAGVMLLGEP